MKSSIRRSLSFFGGVAVRHSEFSETAKGEEVSGNFFSGIGARLEKGRGFTLTVRPLKSMLYQMSPFDLASFAVAVGAMILVAVCASVIPARRAASIEPMRALRAE